MRASLHFDLPEEEAEYKACVNARDVQIALDEFQSELRSKRKYGEHSAESIKAYDEVWELFWSCFKGLVE